jgi:hypothetical protein
LDGHKKLAGAAERDQKLSIRGLISTCLAVAIAGLSSARVYSKDGKADIVLRNGKIYTADKLRVVLDRDILTADPFSIGNTKVLAAYLDGRLVYDAAKSAAEHSEDEEKTIGGTSARRGCASGCTATDAPLV